MGRWRTLALTSLIIILPMSSGLAETRVLTLDDPGASACYDSWVEGNCRIELINTTGEDCWSSGICLFNGDAWPGGLYFPYRMLVDLEGLAGIETVSIDVYDGWELGCVQAWLYAGGVLLASGTSSSVGSWFTLTLSAGGGVPTQLVISGWDGAVDEIRIEGEGLTAVDESTWSTVKALY